MDISSAGGGSNQAAIALQQADKVAQASVAQTRQTETQQQERRVENVKTVQESPPLATSGSVGTKFRAYA